MPVLKNNLKIRSGLYGLCAFFNGGINSGTTFIWDVHCKKHYG
jgi:hypothetical protein